jgi:aldehyde:ferredoxin oxidoreductase
MSKKTISIDDVPQGYLGLGGRDADPIAEREFNKKAGFTNHDDRLPRFFYEEPLPPHNAVFTISDEGIDSTFDF